MAYNYQSPTSLIVAEGQQTPALNGVNFPVHPRRVARVAFTEDLRPSEHLDHTFRLKLSGWQAAHVKPDVLAAILLDEGLLYSADVWRNGTYYRFQNPTERYISLKGQENRHELKSGLTIEACLDPLDRNKKGTIEIEEVGNEMTRIVMQFVPAAATREYVQLLLKKAGIDAEEIEQNGDRADLWRCTTRQKECEIPHYITGDFSNSRAPEDKKAILVTIPGRQIECYFCGVTSHWSNRCQDGKEVRQTRYQMRENEKTRRQERAKAAVRELEEATARQKERERREDQAEIRRQEEEDRQQQEREEEEERRELVRMRKEEKMREEREEEERKKEEEERKNEKQRQKEEKKAADAQARKDKSAREKEERQKKKEEEEKLMDSAILQNQKEREASAEEEAVPSLEGGAASNVRGDDQQQQHQDKINESLSYDQGPFGFKNSPFPESPFSVGCSRKVKQSPPVRSLFPDGGSQLVVEVYDDDLTSSGNIPSYQRPKPKRQKTEQDALVDGLGLAEGDTDAGAPEIGAAAESTPRSARLSPPLGTPFTWEDLTDDETDSDNPPLIIDPSGENNQTPEQPLV